METLSLLAIFLAASFFRLFRLGDFSTLTAEIAQHYLEIIKLTGGQILLNGPLTSHPWLRLSAIPYYLFFPIFWIFKYHPLTLNYLVTLADLATIPLNYLVIRKVFDKKTAFVSTLLLAFSPLDLIFARGPGFFSLVLPLTYALILSIYLIIERKLKDRWPVFLVLGLMISLHAASLMLVPFFILLFFLIGKTDRKTVMKSIAAFAIPNIPFLLSDAKTGFSMTRNLILWIPYKLLNFLTGKTLGLNRVRVTDQTFSTIGNFFKTSFFPPEALMVVGFAIIAFLLYYFLLKRRPALDRILFSWLLFGVIVLMIHKNPPLHYFVPIFYLPVILVSRALTTFFGNKRWPVLVLIIVMVLVIDIRFIFSNRYLYYDPKMSAEFVPYNEQVKASQIIIKDAKGKKFQLRRVGPFDSYKNGFKENYEFLMWRMGNRPTSDSKKTYLIVEGKADKTKGFKKIGQAGKISIYRNQ